MKELIKRWQLESPPFFKKMTRAAMVVLASAATLYASHETGVINLGTYTIFGISLLTISKHLAEISIIVAIVAKTTVKPQVPNQEL